MEHGQERAYVLMTLDEELDYIKKKEEKEISPLTALRSLQNNMQDNLQKAEQQILNKRVDRVNNILYLLLVLLYAIGVGIALKYLV